MHSLLIDAGVLTYLAVTKIFPSSAEAEQAAADRGTQVRAALKVLWDTAEEEEGKYLEACAHVRRVARSHLPVARETHTSNPLGASQWRASSEPQHTRQWAVSQRGKRARTATSGQCAQEEDATRLERAVLRALALRHDLGCHSQRIQSFTELGLPQQDQEGLLRCLAVHKAGAATTIEQHLRSLTRLGKWADARGKSPWTLSAPELAIWVKDTAGGAKSVPRQLLAALKWAHAMYTLPWPLEDPLIQATERLSSRQAAAERKQAAPYEQGTIDDLLQTFQQGGPLEEQFISGFLLMLALAVLRFSDLHRVSCIALGRDSLYGTSWKSKKKAGSMPWAMLRLTHHGQDLGRDIMAVFKAVLPSVQVQEGEDSWKTQGLIWPHMALMCGTPQLAKPVRKGSYHSCINMQAWIHRKMGHRTHFTLHSPRFYMPSLAGQMQLPIDERNLLGHWGPGSTMALRYDQARCAGELVAKRKIMQALQGGFEPAGPFELPRTRSPTDVTSSLRSRQAQEVAAASVVETCPIASEAPPESADPPLPCLFNKASQVLHRCVADTRQTKCPYVRDPSLPHYNYLRLSYPETETYLRCPRCWAASPLQLPIWEAADPEEIETEVINASSGTSDADSSTESSVSARS